MNSAAAHLTKATVGFASLLVLTCSTRPPPDSTVPRPVAGPNTVSAPRGPAAKTVPNASTTVPTASVPLLPVGSWESEIAPLEWNGQHLSCTFGREIAYDAKALFVSGAAEEPGQRSGLYVFEPIRHCSVGCPPDQTEEETPIVAMKWQGRYSIADGTVAVGLSIRACGRGFVATTGVGNALWFTRSPSGWDIPKELTPPSGVRLGDEPFACAGDTVVFAGTRESTPVFVKYSLESEHWFVAPTEIGVRGLALASTEGVLAAAYERAVRLIDAGNFALLHSIDSTNEVWPWLAVTSEWLFFGTSLSSIEVYRRQGDAWQRTQQIKLSENANGIVTAGDILAVGIPHDGGDDLRSTGSVRVYRRQISRWTAIGTITATNPVPYAQFGARLALTNGELIISAPGSIWVPGAVYVFDLLANDRARAHTRWKATTAERIFPFVFDPGTRFP